jgi:hypothetical protein
MRLKPAPGVSTSGGQQRTSANNIETGQSTKTSP